MGPSQWRRGGTKVRTLADRRHARARSKIEWEGVGCRLVRAGRQAKAKEDDARRQGRGHIRAPESYRISPRCKDDGVPWLRVLFVDTFRTRTGQEGLECFRLDRWILSCRVGVGGWSGFCWVGPAFITIRDAGGAGRPALLLLRRWCSRRE